MHTQLSEDIKAVLLVITLNINLTELKCVVFFLYVWYTGMLTMVTMVTMAVSHTLLYCTYNMI